MPLAAGQTAPDFTLVDENRQARHLAEYRGQNVVLAFYPGAFTGGCTKEVCSLRDNLARLNDLNAQVFGISVDPPFAQKVWSEQNQLNFPLLSDYNRSVVQAYDVALSNLAGLEGYTAAKRVLYVIDRNGVIRYVWTAPANNPIPDYDELSQVLNGLGA